MVNQPHYGTNNGTETAEIREWSMRGWRASRLPSLKSLQQPVPSVS